MIKTSLSPRRHRFNSKAEKKPVPKRSMYIGSLLNECSTVHDELVWRGLGVLFEEPNETNLTVMLEFYVNSPKREDNVCIVRMKEGGFFQRSYPKGLPLAGLYGPP